MASVYSIRSVWNETSGSAYRRGVDYEDDGSGTPQVIPGSQLEADDANGDTIKYVQGVGSDSAPGTDTYYKIDAAYCGVCKLAALDTEWSSGSEVQIDLERLHVNEHLRSHQSNCSFNGAADLASCRELAVGDWIALRLGLAAVDGTGTWRKEWRFKVTERKHSLDGLGIRTFNFFAADPSEEIRLADISAIPRGTDAEMITYPRTDDDPAQQSLIGRKLYMFSDLLSAVKPAGAELILNAPDFVVERLPEQGDGLELLVAALDASACDLRWDVSRMVVEQYEPRPQLVSLVLTDDHILEARRQLGERRKALDSVRIERPHVYPSPDLAIATPSTDLPPANSSGSSPLPSESLTESRLSGDITLYQVNLLWHPSQLYVDYEPGPLLFAFGDTRYLKVAWSGDQLRRALDSSPGQISVQPATFFTPNPVYGYNGLDWYWKVPLAYVKIQESNLDYVDVWVVSRAGYNDPSGAVATRTVTPVANARVRLRDPISGITLGPQTTNGDGYARFATGGYRAKWEASVYHLTDAYLANKLDDFTDGHPYDDVPGNDSLGPDNSIIVSEQWQLPEEQGVQLLVKWRTGREPSEGPSASLSDLYEAYRSTGAFTFGQAGPEVLTVDELSSLDVDPANINTEVGAGLWGEKKIGESEEELVTFEVTRMFSGTECEVGRVVRLELTVDETISEDVRIVTREIDIRGAELVETFSSEVDKFVNKLESRFAMKQPVEVKLRQVLQNTKRAFDWITSLAGQRADEGNLGG